MYVLNAFVSVKNNHNQTGYNKGVPNISGGVAQLRKSSNIGPFLKKPISFNKKERQKKRRKKETNTDNTLFAQNVSQ